MVPKPLWERHRLRGLGNVCAVDVNDVARQERKLYAAPEFVIFFDGVRIIVEDTEIMFAYLLADNDPHAFYGNGLLFVVHGYSEYELHEVSRLK